ncbi:MAG: hypothetical protein AB1489_32275, partial [Acidobacteriota bacterium]
MSTNKLAADLLTMEQAKDFLADALGCAPDDETLLELVRCGQLAADKSENSLAISRDSLQALVTQLQKVPQRDPRLALHAVDIWRREEHQRAVAVTLATKNSVVTAERHCSQDEEELLEAAVMATLAAIEDALNRPLPLHLLHVKQYTLTEVSQSFVNVLVEAGEGESSRTLSGVATINP